MNERDSNSHPKSMELKTLDNEGYRDALAPLLRSRSFCGSFPIDEAGRMFERQGKYFSVVVHKMDANRK